jgi:dTDP-glucose pyrophosphorylase
MNILIPMAGLGQRFSQAGYKNPKPLIDVNGKAMIQLVVENLGLMGTYIFLVQKTHYEMYDLGKFLNTIAPNCKIIQVDGITEGATCTTLLAKHLISNDEPLLISNSDQFIEWDGSLDEFFEYDGGILTFQDTQTKWSYARIDSNGIVKEVAEKNPISTNATVGIYFWKKGSDYVKYAEQMISKNIRVNNEFYICPVYNEAILDQKIITSKMVNKMWGLGTPEDLNLFLSNKN